MSKNEIVRVDFAATPLRLFVRCVLLVIGMLLVVPAPWVLAWFFRWSFDQIRFSDNTRASFSGEASQILLPVMAFAIVVILGQFAGKLMGTYADFVPILSIFFTAYLTLIIYRWTWSNVDLSSGTKISFVGEYLPFLGWQLLASAWLTISLAAGFFSIIAESPLFCSKNQRPQDGSK